MKPTEQAVQGQNIYKMRTVSARTGFSPTLLRAWERRYGFLEPMRLPGGHRVYTETDLRVLSRVKELLSAGRSIGSVASLGRQGILALGSPSVDHDGLEDDARKLACCELQTFRTERYGGEGLSVSLRELALEDLATVDRLYNAVKGVYELWLYLDDSAPNENLVKSKLAELLKPDFAAAMARLGARGCDYSEMTRAAVEDSKQGALVPLLHQSQELQAGRGSLKTCVLLARDQAKIMRNAFHDIDTNLRPADESAKAHALGPMVHKLSHILSHCEVSLDWDGSVSSRCLETSAVDRVLYNFVRRVEATGSELTTLWVGPINNVLTRWAFKFDGESFRSFEARELPVLAVSKAVGVTPAAVLAQRYLGWDKGWAWFHWPIFEVPPGAHLCSCDI